MNDMQYRFDNLLWEVRHMRNRYSGMADYCESRGMAEQASAYREITDELNRVLDEDRIRAEEM